MPSGDWQQIVSVAGNCASACSGVGSKSPRHLSKPEAGITSGHSIHQPSPGVNRGRIYSRHGGIGRHDWPTPKSKTMGEPGGAWPLRALLRAVSNTAVGDSLNRKGCADAAAILRPSTTG